MTQGDDDFVAIVKATAELATKDKLSATAVAMLANDLVDLPREQILAALRRCRREGVKKLTAAEVIGRIDDGRPAPDEAWSMLPKDDKESVVWCEEMAMAKAFALGLIEAGDWMAARVVFKETYAGMARSAKESGVAPTWSLLRGSDQDGLERALLTAIAHGRVTSTYAKSICQSIGMKSVPIYPLTIPIARAAFDGDEEKEDKE